MFQWLKARLNRFTCNHRFRYGLGPRLGHPMAYHFDINGNYLEPYWCVRCGKQVVRPVGYIWAEWERDR